MNRYTVRSNLNFVFIRLNFNNTFIVVEKERMISPLKLTDEIIDALVELNLIKGSEEFYFMDESSYIDDRRAEIKALFADAPLIWTVFQRFGCGETRIIAHLTSYQAADTIKVILQTQGADSDCDYYTTCNYYTTRDE